MEAWRGGLSPHELAVITHEFESLDRLPPEWRALTHEFPCVDVIIDSYIMQHSISHARDLCQKDCDSWTSRQWPTSYSQLGLKPFYNPLVRKPYS